MALELSVLKKNMFVLSVSLRSSREMYCGVVFDPGMNWPRQEGYLCIASVSRLEMSRID